ncbi:MAG TPA: GNAT family N-acetyltransferase [Chthonomonadaceae bacterium]|nr:GNAT family N-acetyltransferase [Chthonomonadaceae bacterium]
MKLQVHRTEYQEIEALRGLYRQEANCQIIHDSALSRGLADPYLILMDGRTAGCGGVWNKYYVGRLMEFYTLPSMRPQALPMFRELLAVSQATGIEAQTNMPLMLTLLYDCATDIIEEAILFEDAFTTNQVCPNGLFRRTTPEDSAKMFPPHEEPTGEWLVEADGAIVATGGFLCHYNPPYGDIFMEVWEQARRKGFGSYLVQELKRICYESGKKPAARCNPANLASRRTLQKAGFLPCGRLLAGKVDTPGERS